MSADLVVLSPHLDDAVLSCGGSVHQASARGESVLIVTLFAGDIPNGVPSEIGAAVLHYMNLERSEAMSRRRSEDAAAAERLGAQIDHRSFKESVFRRSASGSFYYPTRGSIFGQPAEEDAAELLPELKLGLRCHSDAKRILAPLAVGSHVDHWLTRRAAEQVFGDRLELYEDFPYVRKWRSLGRALGSRSSWSSETTSLASVDIEAKIEAIDAYESQVPPLFGSSQRMGRAVRRQCRKKRGERRWRAASVVCRADS